MKKISLILLALIVAITAIPVSVAATEPPELFENCGLSYDGNDVYGVPERTEYTEIGSRFINPSAITVAGYDSQTSYVVTGSYFTVSGTTYYFIILGDVSLDGKITSADYLRIKRFFSGTSTLDGVREKAANVNRDSKVSSLDYLAVKSYLKGTYPLPSVLPDIPEGNGISVASPTVDETVHIANSSVRGIMTLSTFSDASLAPYADGDHDCYAPLPVDIKWISRANDYILRIADNTAMTNAAVYQGTGHGVSIPDLFGGTKYYYTITVSGVTTPVRSFTTASEPRTITIDGVSNCRDLGGYVSADGTKVVKQGILYRTARLNDITAQGIIDVRDKYGIRTEIDLSGGGNSSASLAGVVNQEYWSIKDYGNITQSTHKENLKNALLVFADSSNYPIMFHCQAGRDRTGTVAMLLLALAGVDELTIRREYNLTWTSWWGHNDSVAAENLNINLGVLFSLFEDEPVLSTAVAEFLVDEIGLTQAQVESIIENITTDSDNAGNEEIDIYDD